VQLDLRVQPDRKAPQARRDRPEQQDRLDRRAMWDPLDRQVLKVRPVTPARPAKT
jgi:hypothetical protein